MNNQDKNLKKLLRASMLPEMGNHPRPDEISIRAYVNGTATEEQKNTVRDAMLFSREFADEMLSTLEAGQDLEDPELAAQMLEAEVPLGKLMSRAAVAGQVPEVGPGGSETNIWDRIRETFWQPAMGLGVAAVLLALIVVPRLGDDPGGNPGVAVVSLSEYESLRGGGLNDSIPLVLIEEETEFVDFIVEYAFDPDRIAFFETTLSREGAADPVLFLRNNESLQELASGLAYPMLRVDAGLLVPGQYVLRFIFVLPDGSRKIADPKSGRFEIPNSSPVDGG